MSGFGFGFGFGFEKDYLSRNLFGGLGLMEDFKILVDLKEKKY